MVTGARAEPMITGASLPGPQDGYDNDPKPYEQYDYYKNPSYQAPDQTKQYSGSLPGADFNK